MLGVLILSTPLTKRSCHVAWAATCVAKVATKTETNAVLIVKEGLRIVNERRVSQGLLILALHLSPAYQVNLYFLAPLSLIREAFSNAHFAQLMASFGSTQSQNGGTRNLMLSHDFK